MMANEYALVVRVLYIYIYIYNVICKGIQVAILATQALLSHFTKVILSALYLSDFKMLLTYMYMQSPSL